MTERHPRRNPASGDNSRRVTISFDPNGGPSEEEWQRIRYDFVPTTNMGRIARGLAIEDWTEPTQAIEVIDSVDDYTDPEPEFPED